MTYAAPRVAETYALLTDGRKVRIRPARASDRARVQALYGSMSPENLRMRFSGAGARLRQHEVEGVGDSWPHRAVPRSCRAKAQVMQWICRALKSCCRGCRGWRTIFLNSPRRTSWPALTASPPSTAASI